MRYEVGQPYVFVRIQFRFGHTNVCSVNGIGAYQPWQDRDLEVRVVTLTCESYHRVPRSYRENEFADGYIFTSPNGERFFNQYPKSYTAHGDDSADWTISNRDQLWFDACRFLTDIDLKISHTDVERVTKLEDIRARIHNSAWRRYLAEIERVICGTTGLTIQRDQSGVRLT